MGNEITKVLTREAIVVAEIRESQFAKTGVLTAVLKQAIKSVSTYSGATHSNSMQDNVFGMDDFDSVEQEFANESTRVAFMDIPASATIKQVQAKFDALPNAVLYRVLSNSPVLHDDHKKAIANEIVELDTIAMSQLVRFGAGHEKEGDLILVDNKIQYAKTFLSIQAKDDVDLRGGEQYLPSEVIEELGLDNPELTPEIVINSQEVA